MLALRRALAFSSLVAVLLNVQEARAQDAPPPPPPSPQGTPGAPATAPAPGAAGATNPANDPTLPPENPIDPGPASIAPRPLSKSAAPKTFIYPGLLLQSDYTWYGGPGVTRYQRANGLGLDNGFRMTRLGMRLGGRVFSKWIFHAMAIVGRSDADNLQRPANNPTVEDAWVGYEFDPRLRIRTGQFQVPYTLDSNEFYPPQGDFLEPTMMTRSITAPEIRPLGVMIWGDDPHYLYALGYLNAGGKITVNGPGDLVARAAIRPFGSGANMIHIGIGGRYGSRDPRTNWYDSPRILNSTFQYPFWSPVYNSDFANEFHIIPSNEQRTLNGEFFAAFGRVDLTGEFALLHQERREAQRAFLDQTLRSGTFSGATYYVAASAWLLGARNRPAAAHGIPMVPPEDPPPPLLQQLSLTSPSVMLGARWEQFFLSYDSNDRSPEALRGGLDAETKRIRVDALQVILNIFFSKQVRLAAEWSTYITPGVPPRILTDCSSDRCTPGLGQGTNQAISPGAVQKGNVTALTANGDFSIPAPNAQFMHQFVIRSQIGF